jgi:hypothetical protein
MYALHSSINLCSELQTAGPKKPAPCTVTTSPGATFDVGKILVITAACAGVTSMSAQAATTTIVLHKVYRGEGHWCMLVGKWRNVWSEEGLCSTT